MPKIVGIDLGTTNSEVSILEGGKPVVIPSSEGARYFPSVVAFTKEGERIIGEAAKRQAVMNPDRTIREIKRKMGTDHKTVIDGKSYTPQEISAIVLQKLKHDAEAYLGEKVTQAVITCPAYFNDNQRTATKDAGKIAGLDVLRIINEPTAAALAYGLDKKGERTIAVLDLGGGTFDVTIMEMGEGVFEVVSTSGDTQLGGSDMDRAVMAHIQAEFKRQHGTDLQQDKQAMQRIRDAAENSKIELSSTIETQINLPFLTAGEAGPKHFDMRLTRSKLEELISPILQRLDAPMAQALGDAKMAPNRVDHVILVGGPTRMPCVRDRFKNFFNKEPERGVDPMECVAIGAAIQGGVLSGEVKDIVLLDVTPLSLGVETLGGVSTKLIERNSTIPTKKSQIFSTAQDNQSSVEIHVLQGERPMSTDNTSLGRFHLVGIPPAPRGVPQVEVAFDIDANGILHVSAKDLGTGKEQKITVTASTKLPEGDINRMVGDAEKYREQDHRKREVAEIRNRGDGLVYSADKTLAEFGDKVSAEDQETVHIAMDNLKQSMKNNDIEQIRKDSDLLEKALHALSAAIYQAAGVEVSPVSDDGGALGGGGDAAIPRAKARPLDKKQEDDGTG